MDLQTRLSGIPGIGFSYAKKLEYLGLLTVSDLINHYPFRYDDFSNLTSSLEANIGEKVTLQGEIWSIKNVFTRSRKVLTQAIFNDGQSPVELTWFNSSWLTKQIKVGDRLQVSGKLNKYKGKMSIMMPVWEILTSTSEVPVYSTSEVGGLVGGLHTGRLVPVYPETFGISSKWIRTKIAQILPQVIDQVKDPLPQEIRQNMLSLNEALQQIHFPESYREVEQASKRLAFDELFFIQLATQKTRLEWQHKTSVKKFQITNSKLQMFLNSLPFELTESQKKVIDEIIDDLKKGVPMNRLVQGEVGSGKTVVAAAIIYLCHLNDFKSLYMAPTEILAFQHYETLQKLLGPFGINIGIYTGSRKFTKQKVSKGKNKKPFGTFDTLNPFDTSPNVIVGTHALLSEKFDVKDVGLIIVDEQQRFGVEQRTLLRAKAKIPHFLTMTATPIPRTVTLTLHGDLDLSVIGELPKNRPKISTHVVPEKKRRDSYQFIKNHIKMGEQAYIITPLIEESETMQSVKAVKVEFEGLKKIFPDLKLGLLHGRLKSKEKEKAINDFKDKKTDILVSTSVVEVGVDVPSATIMVIEGAERFGLAQLHQLRGRIGRGTEESFCLLYTSNDKSQERSRLKNLETTFDGLKLAELDLKMRGSGEVFGTKQSGRWDLKIADLTDLELIEKTRTAAKKILQDNPTLDKHPLLQAQLTMLASNVMPD